MAQSVYSMETETCPKCQGMGMISIGDNTLQECTCLAIARLKKYTESLSGFSFLTQSKLLEPLAAGRSLCVECSDSRVFKSHLRTALVRRKDVTKTWRIVSPSELMSMSFDQDSKVAEKLHSIDLLIINAPNFLHYDKACDQHAYIIGQRNSNNKPTWIVVKSKKDFLNIKVVAGNKEFRTQIEAMPDIKLTLVATEPLIKKSSKPSVSIVHGEGVSGIDEKLMVFHPDMDERVRYLKEHVNEWKRKASVNNRNDPES